MIFSSNCKKLLVWNEQKTNQEENGGQTELTFAV